MSQQRFLALDGLRAVSVLLVVGAHLEWLMPIPQFPGGFGVTVFFFISGFIITRLLLEESTRTGRMDLPAFYVRRVRRLAPALLVFVLLSYLSVAAIGGRTPLPDVLATIFYFANYYDLYWHYTVPSPERVWPPPLQVTWSLAVEEHFYLIFPPLLLWLRNRTRQLFFCLVAFVAAELVWRLYLVYGVGLDSLPMWYTYKATDTRLDSIAYGCLLSVLVHRASVEGDASARRWLDLLGSRWMLLLSGAVLLSTFVGRNQEFRQSIRYSLQGLALIPLHVTLFWRGSPPPWLRVPLESRPVVFLGEISYSLYLYHYLGVTLAGSLDLGPDLARFAFAAAFGPLVATASYFLVERPLRAGSSRRSGLPQDATRTSTNLS